MAFFNNLRKLLKKSENILTVKNGNNVNFVKYDWNSYFASQKDMYNIDTVRSTLNKIASDIARIEVIPQIIKDNTIETTKKYNLHYLLNLRPNQYQSAFDFWYKTITNLYLQSNAFILIQWDSTFQVIESMINIEYDYLEILIDGKQRLFIKFVASKSELIILYDDLVHLRKFYVKGFLGEKPEQAIDYSSKLLNELNNSIINAMQQSGVVKGVVETNTILKDEDLDKMKQKWVQKNLKLSDSGIVFLDKSQKFIPVSPTGTNYTKEQMEFFRNNINHFWNIPPAIVTGEYTVQQYQAYLTSVLQPIIVQIEQEFTYKIFTKKELELGNYIKFDTTRLFLLSNLIDIGKLMEHGIISINEGRKILNLPPIEGGDIHRITKNSSDLNQNENSSNDDDKKISPGREPPSKALNSKDQTKEGDNDG